MILVFALPALAHSPHDVVQFVSVATDGTTLGNEWNALVITTDGGHTVRYLAPPFGPPTCAIAVDAPRWTVADEDGALWFTGDAGVNWAPVSGPAEVTRCLQTAELSSGRIALVGTNDGAWESVDGENWTRLGAPSPAPVVDLARTDDGTTWAVLTDGAVYDVADWSMVDAGPAVAVGSDGVTVLVAPAVGPVRRLWDDTPLAAPEGVLRLAAGEGGWLACTATEAVWVSRDDGATWGIEAEGLDPIATGSTGTAAGGVNYLDLAATDGSSTPTWALASWAGLFLRAPDGGRWQQAPLRTIPFVEAARWLDDGRLLLGSYGGGIYLGTPLGADWVDISAGIDWPWSRELHVAPGADGSALGDVYMGGGNVLYLSHDQGATWAAARIGMPVGGDGVALHPDYPATPRLLFAGIDADGHAAVSRSEDAGESWTPTALPGACDHKPDAVALTRTYAWAACGTEVSRSDEGGATWTLYGALPAPATAGLLPLGEALYAGTELGVYRVDPDEQPVPDLDEGGTVDAFVVMPDGTRYVAFAGQGLYRAPLGSGAAEHLGWAASDPIRAITVNAAGAIVIGAFTGAWLSEDGGESWALASGYDRYDDRDGTWVKTGWEDVEMGDAKARAVHRGGAGATASWEVEGEELAILGAADHARLHIDIDGADPVDVVIADATTPQVVWRREVEAGRHVVNVHVDEGTFRLDGGERWRTPGPGGEVGGLRDPAEDDKITEPDCGCASHAPGTAPAGLLGAGLLLSIRRRTSRAHR